MSTIQSDAPESMSATLVERFERRYARYRFAVVVMETRFGREWRSVWTGKRFSFAPVGHHLLSFAEAVAIQREHGGKIAMVRVQDDEALPCCVMTGWVQFSRGEPWAAPITPWS